MEIVNMFVDSDLNPKDIVVRIHTLHAPYLVDCRTPLSEIKNRIYLRMTAAKSGDNDDRFVYLWDAYSAYWTTFKISNEEYEELQELLRFYINEMNHNLLPPNRVKLNFFAKLISRPVLNPIFELQLSE